MTTPFESWVTACTSPTTSPETLQSQSRAHFQHLSSASASTSSTTISSIAQDLSIASAATPNGALAQLLSSLRPVILSEEGRVRALHCLRGALEGCTSLTHGVRQAVGYFLVELCRSSSVDSSMYVDGEGLSSEEITAKLQDMETVNTGTTASSEEVRDEAICSLKALLSSDIDVFPTSKSKSGDSLNEALSVLYESMELRMDLSMRGVRYRCDAEDTQHEKTMNPGDGYEQDFLMEETLMTLPRAKRSMCCNLLEGALDGFRQDVDKITTLSKNGQVRLPDGVLRTMVHFASMVASCIHGETDPRCLLQMFRLLNKMQRVMCPLFDHLSTNENEMNDKNNTLQFPSTQVFDAVAPYYPVQFTPPKNDPHRITQEMLRRALMAVLCEEGVSLKPTIIQDGDENMIIHAARMFMERLDPNVSRELQPPSGVEDEEVDKCQAVGDLSTLLLDEKSARTPSLNMTRVSNGLLSELASTLTRVHEVAVSNHSSETWKALASSIRQLACSVAYSLEVLAVSTAQKGDNNNRKRSAWETFVISTTSRLTPSLESSPQGLSGRASTAYLASLAAGGGIETLNKILGGCIPRFFVVISRFDRRNYDPTIAAMRGIAALMSSCRVTVEHWEKENDGVKIHPHPLALFLFGIVERITQVFDAGVENSEESMLSAVVAALESTLTSSDLSALDEMHVNMLVKMLSWITEIIVEDRMTDAPTLSDEWKRSSSRAIGVFIAAFSENIVNESSSKLSSFADTIFPRVIECAISSDTSVESRYRADWVILAAACSNGSERVARNIVEAILAKAVTTLRSPQVEFSPFKAFSFICHNGGPNVVASAFHSLAPPNATYLDIVNELCLSPNTDTAKGQLSVGISQLKLPAIINQEEEASRSVADAQIERAYSILPYLLPAFESPSASISFESLVELLDQVLPPLSRWDEAKLCVIVPLLNATLCSVDDVKELLTQIPSDRLETMTRQLSEFIVSSQHENRSRASAASCLSYIFLHTSDSESISIRQIISEAIFESLVGSLKTLQDAATNTLAHARVHDIFNFLGHLGSIAACKGGSHLSCADDIATFLVETACVASSSFPFYDSQIELTSTDRDALSTLPALAYGNMLSVLGLGPNGSPFWRQRIILKTMPVVMKVVHDDARSQKPPQLGPLALCSIFYCLPSSLLDEVNRKQMTPMLIAGLVHLSKQLSELVQFESSDVLDVLGLIIAALIKVFAINPEILTRFTGVITSSLLRLCSYKKYDESYFSKQMLALQCLESMANSPFSKNSKLRERDQVTAALSNAVDHPSVIVRQAVVHVKNCWCCL